MKVGQYTLPSLPLVGQKKLMCYEQPFSSSSVMTTTQQFEGTHIMITIQQKGNTHAQQCYNKTIHTGILHCNSFIAIITSLWKHFRLHKINQIISNRAFTNIIVAFILGGIACHLLISKPIRSRKSNPINQTQSKVTSWR